MNRAVIQRATSLIKAECANFDSVSATCWEQDYPCPQIVELKKALTAEKHEFKLCKWFKDGVLPTDPALEAELTNSEPRKGKIRLCAGCGQPILTGCNRQQFCAECGRLNRKRTHARTMRASRAK